jgi:soluble lytic murein transglycosylase-like protein
MKRKRARVPFAVLAIPGFLVLSIQALPSRPAIPAKIPVLPAAGEARSGSGLGAELQSVLRSHSDFTAISRDDIDAALVAQPRRFGLFRPDSAVIDEGELLRRIPFGAILAAAAERNHVDPLLLAAVVEAESRFAPHARSREGAVGLMQLLPSTGHDFGVRDLKDPYANVDAGSRLLRRLLARFKDRADLALAAYNTGPETVARYGCVPPYRETQDFVKRVLARYAEHRSKVGRTSQPRPATQLAAARRAHDRSAAPAAGFERGAMTR